MSNTTDIDMKNAHPQILSYLCKKHNIKRPNLDYYIANRETILAEFKNRDESKELFLCALNKDSLSKAIKHKFFNFICKEIQKQMINIKEYDEIVETVPEDKKFNWKGVQSIVLCAIMKT